MPPRDRSIVLVGLMGAGKTSVGRCLARHLDLPFSDADEEIARAAGRSIAEIFADFGEAAFRNGERRVIARLLAGPPRILATGGGAYMDPETRGRIRAAGMAVWLRAELDVLHERTRRKTTRPLLADGDPRATLERLIRERYPVYAEADIVVDSRLEPLETTVARVLDALGTHLAVSRANAGALS